jgi:catechol 2,3-dioxygenase-like lactoylglutathione lyase family enzyme
MIQGFHHAGISVPNLETARSFYEKLLGFKVVGEESWEAPSPVYDQGVGLKDSSARGLLLQGSNTYLELFEYSAPKPAGYPLGRGANDYGISHLCFQVDDVHQEYQRLQGLGGITMNPPIEFPEGGGAVYCRDPFGNLIEFTTAEAGYPAVRDLPAVAEEIPFDGSLNCGAGI